jgi:hypothetical protein
MREQNLISESHGPSSPISRDTELNYPPGGQELPQLHGTSEKNGFEKEANETQRGMQSRHLTMIGMSSNTLFSWHFCRLNHLFWPSYWWDHRYWNILECRDCTSIELIFTLKLTFIASRPYRQGALEVPFYLILFSVYSFTLL